MSFIWVSRNSDIKDECGFLSNVDNWGGHRPFLLLALEMTRGGNVLELGCGNGSTPFLQKYCKLHNRNLYSYDYDPAWANKFGSKFVNGDWEKTDYCDRNYSVALIDESPAWHRAISIKNLFEKVDIFVVHDSEPAADTCYHISNVRNLFKYISDDKRHYNWTTFFSNKYSLPKKEYLSLIL